MIDQKLVTLSNGLNVLGERNPHSKSVAMGFFVNTGARDETDEESGISHFLEHMMFKGTAKRSALDVTYDLGALGAQANAYTSEETTVYYAAVLPENFEGLFELLSDMLQPAIDQAEFDTEKNVILEEIALYQDRPSFYLFENALLRHFSGHNAGNSVLGTTESVSAITSDQMKDYLTRRYAASNITLVVSGNFEWSTLQALAEEHCGQWPSNGTQRSYSEFTPENKTETLYKKDLSQAHILLIGDGVSAKSEERYALNILTTILGDGTGSKLYWKLVDTGLAESAGFELDTRDGLGVTYAYASTTPDRSEKVSDLLEEVLQNPLDFSLSDLERAKNKICSRLVLSGELPMGRLMSLGNSWIYRKEMHSLDIEVEKYRGIELVDIETALAGTPLKSWSKFTLLPEKN